MKRIKEILRINRHLKVLNRISQNFHSFNDIKIPLKMVIENILKEMKLDETTILLYKKESKALYSILFATERGIQEGEEFILIEPNDFFASLLSNETKYEYLPKEFTLYIPIKYRNLPIGILRARNDISKKPINKKYIQLLVDYTNIIAAGIYDANRSSENQKFLNKLVALSNITMSAISTLEKKRILGIILKDIVMSLGFDRVKLYLINDKGDSLNGVMSFDIRGRIKIIKNEKYPIDKGTNRFYNELIARQKRMFKLNKDIFGLVKVFPMKVKNQIIGFMEVDNIFSRQIISKEDIDYLKLFINQTSIAIENARLYNRVTELSIKDELSGLYNARHFYQQLENELARIERYQNPLAIIMIDIDYFKKYNDNYGHLTGDNIIRDLGEIISNSVRTIDIPARYGGDEFIVLLVNCSLDQAVKVAQRIKRGVDNSNFTFKGKKLKITVSMGVAVHPPRKISGKALVKLADSSLYKAKQAGRNKIYPS
ncbi:sensor domain-containing diguanylate cyclase [bacterium]|nr:sensor domain-containing diguanylate cyclase [bacterium]